MKSAWMIVPQLIRLSAAVVLALGLAAAGWQVARGLVAMRTADRSVEVRGLAERDVRADLAIWPLRFVVTGNDLAAAQGQIADAEARIRAFLESGGLPAEAVSVQGFDVTDALAQVYRSGPVESRFVVMETLLVRTQDVDRVAALQQRAGELAAAGVALTSESAPAFVFTRLNDVKPGMIAEATRAARIAAEQFAQDAAARIGGIRRGSQGLFQILPRDDVPGLPPERQIDKELRVVSTIEFYLVD
jgi:hypothetical protein